MQTATDLRFNIFEMMSALIYSRVVHPCSKARTYEEVFPKLFEPYDFSLDQLYTGLEYISALNMKKSLRSTIISSLKNISPILPSLTSTAQTFTLRSTEKILSAEKVHPKKTEEDPSLALDCSLTLIRSRSV